jgi:hypothetical protein
LESVASLQATVTTEPACLPSLALQHSSIGHTNR